MKKLIGLTLAVLVAAFVTASPAAAGSAEPVYKFDTTVKPAKPYKIAVVLKNFTNPFWLTHQKAGRPGRQGPGGGHHRSRADQAGQRGGADPHPGGPDLQEVDAVVVAPANTRPSPPACRS